MENIQGELAIILEADESGKPFIVGYKRPEGDSKFEKEELVATYLQASMKDIKYTDQEAYTLNTYLIEALGNKSTAQAGKEKEKQIGRAHV